MFTDDELAEITCFRRSALYRDMTQALHNTLILGRQRCDAPHHDSPGQRYHILVKNPAGAQKLKPVLGRDMAFETCEREPGVGYCRDELHCFNPNECAVEFMDNFLLRKKSVRRGMALLDTNRDIDVLLNVYKDCIPSQYMLGWRNIIMDFLLELWSPSSRKWDPKIHGVHFWMRAYYLQTTRHFMYFLTRLE
ncbi:hypothetical protein FLONG3_3877 [Fusarium longipes]|uniref:Uncharacterized protein n=1 Tax=Fusarium longipes TaxID=694270 RepID=A0A395T146_9HYPO|nr:hypothetical protein FLONG3_3877 [Fusarium longipes]